MSSVVPRSSLATIRASNAAFSPTYTPVALFIGGTSGIGQGIAEAFARHTKGNAHIIIGQNHVAADSIISSFPKSTITGKGTTYEFIHCDVTRMKNVESTTRELLTRLLKINFLVMSPGFMTLNGTRDETEEGINRKLVAHYYARWKFTYNLIPALLKAKSDGEDAKVMSVLAAGRGVEIDLNDIGLKKTYSVYNSSWVPPTYTDLMIEGFAERHPQLAFIHAFPGAAAYIVPPLIYPLTVLKEESGEYMLHGLLNTATKGACRIGRRGEDIGMQGYFGSPEARKKLWEHTASTTQISPRFS